MTEAASLRDRVRGLLRAASAADVDPALRTALEALGRRLEEPLRVAIAGKVKAGKSTLLNALVGQKLAPTDAGECTRIVTWYQAGTHYRVTLYPRQGSPRQAQFQRQRGAIAVDLGGLRPEDVDRMVVEWPSPHLQAMTLIDTPGIASASTGGANWFEETGSDHPNSSDAVIYLMRHLHANDVRFLEAFHDRDHGQARPVNAVGVLSRADEIGCGKLSSLESARRVAARWREDPKVRQLCQAVVPVAGLLAETGTTLRESEFQALQVIAGAAPADIHAILLSSERFLREECPVALDQERRAALLDRLGLFGVRISVALVRERKVDTARALATELVRRSGLHELRTVLLQQFAARAELLKARSTLLGLEAVLHRARGAAPSELEAQLEQVRAGAHELVEIGLLDALRAGDLTFGGVPARDVERLLGAEGADPRHRLGLPPDAPVDDVRNVALSRLAYWQRRAESPLAQRHAAPERVLVRTCEGIIVGLHSTPGDPAGVGVGTTDRV
ncbi:MAG TPA: dynamin family protein [Candidatus Binatia bacterium]|nr:dynamin family protein [Candidatus Binatia bacterium]